MCLYPLVPLCVHPLGGLFGRRRSLEPPAGAVPESAPSASADPFGGWHAPVGSVAASAMPPRPRRQMKKMEAGPSARPTHVRVSLHSRFVPILLLRLVCVHVLGENVVSVFRCWGTPRVFMLSPFTPCASA